MERANVQSTPERIGGLSHRQWAGDQDNALALRSRQKFFLDIPFIELIELAEGYYRHRSVEGEEMSFQIAKPFGANVRDRLANVKPFQAMLCDLLISAVASVRF